LRGSWLPTATDVNPPIAVSLCGRVADDQVARAVSSLASPKHARAAPSHPLRAGASLFCSSRSSLLSRRLSMLISDSVDRCVECSIGIAEQRDSVGEISLLMLGVGPKATNRHPHLSRAICLGHSAKPAFGSPSRVAMHATGRNMRRGGRQAGQSPHSVFPDWLPGLWVAGQISLR
jgi:hypothetical protein